MTTNIKLLDGAGIRLAAGARDCPTTIDLARNLDDGIYTKTTDEDGRELTPLEVLERADPDGAHVGTSWENTTVLQRLLMAYGIRTRHDHLGGLPANRVGDFFDAGGGRGAILFPLWIEAGMRAAMVSALDGQRFYQSTLLGNGNTVLNPHAMATRINADPLQRSILGLLVGTQEISDGRPYMSFVMTEDSAKTTMHRVTEMSPPSYFSITGTERTNRLEDYGIGIRISYKALRQYSLPVLQQHLDWITQRNMRVKEQLAYEAHYSGDGNSAAATNTNVSALAGGVAGTVTYQNILEFLRLYEADGDYSPTIAIGTSAVLAKFDGSNTGTANHMTFGPLQMAMLGQSVRPEARNFPPMYARSYATANKMGFFDASTLRMVYVPVLVERDRVIAGKFEEIIISEEIGFDHIRDGGRRTLDVSA